MIDLEVMLARILSWVEFSRRYWSLEWPLTATFTAALAVTVGLILAFWGARLLRMIYVVGFMAAGAAAGVRFARQVEMDPLIGFVLGAGLVGLLGHLLFRWWVGVTAAVCAVLVVAAVGGPWLADCAEVLADNLWEQATGHKYFAELSASSAPAEEAAERIPASAAWSESGGGDRPTPIGFLVALGKTVWAEHQPYARRLVLGAGAAAVLALALGVLLPRLTMILGTSVIGVLAMVIGGVVLVKESAPSLWQLLQAHLPWVWGAIGVVLLISVTFQARCGRMREVAAAVPAAASG